MRSYLDFEAAIWPQPLDLTHFDRLDIEAPSLAADGRLSLRPEGLSRLAELAFTALAFRLPRSEIRAFGKIAQDKDASPAEAFVCQELLRNAQVAQSGVLPLCQDTGTASVYAYRGQDIFCPADERLALSGGARACYLSRNLRFSQLWPQDVFAEVDSRDNMPAIVDIEHSHRPGYRFLFVAKGGGSSNKTAFFQETKALLNEKALEDFLAVRIAALGTAACPPYLIAVVIGGQSPEQNLKALKLASAGAFDRLTTPNVSEGIFRSPEWERRVLSLAAESGFGAQYGGRHMAHSARVLRLPRHAASLFISIGVSCNAHRNALAYLDRDGYYLERLSDAGDVDEQLRQLPRASTAAARPINLDRPMPDILAQLADCRPGQALSLNGELIVARDAVHARLAAQLRQGKPLPHWFRDHPIVYAGPAECPPGLPIGSFGPTTAGRMDSYLDEFMAAGASLVSVAKGNRSPEAARACARHGGCYLGLIGGAAALLAKEHVETNELVAFGDLGMEAARLIRVREMPAFVLIDCLGQSLF